MKNVILVIYETREECFIRISKHRGKSSKYDALRSIFDEIQRVWMADETLSRMFDVYHGQIETKTKE